MSENIPMIRIPLSAAYNTRDLGGYPTKDNKVTQFNRFIRSDFPHIINDQDVKLLKQKNIGVVIDLRTTYEVEKSSHPLENIDFIDYYHLPIFREFDSYRYCDHSEEPLYELYKGILNNEKVNLAKIFDIMLSHPDQAVMFHCTAGKDRTGVIAMLLLGLARVYDNDIISNYEVSFTHTKARGDLNKLITKIPFAYFESKTEIMEKTLQFFYERYGSFEKYFSQLGYSVQDQEQLQSSFLR